MRRIDALLVLMVVIWGVNYSIIKQAFAEIPPQPFNSMRLVLASAVFLVAIRVTRGRTGPMSSVFFTPNPLTRADEWGLFWLGIIGHLGYQFCFVGGVAATSVSNAALIIGTTPVVVAVASSLLGRERITPLHWLGAAISITGIYFVVGRSASFGGGTLKGDLLIMVSVGCWAAYTIGASRLIARHSPLFVTGMTMAIGGVPYVALTFPQFLGLDWARVSVFTWISLVLSALLALNVAYLGLVHRRAEDRRRADVDVLEPGADRRHDVCRVLAGRAAVARQVHRRRRGSDRRVTHEARPQATGGAD